MNNIYERKAHIPLSFCDNTGKLSIYHIFTLFMDIATEHAKILKLSSDDLGDDLFWVTVKTKVQIVKRPDMYDEVTLKTWPEKPSRVRANRHYIISSENGVLIKGKSEWTVVNTKTGKLSRVGELYGEAFEFCEDISIEEKFARMSDDFSDSKTVEQYTVRSTDIDLVQHMNNAAYIRTLVGAISTNDLELSPIEEIEIAYKNQSYEGEALTIKCREADDAVEYGMIKTDGTVCATIRMVRK
ncbi:MAG: hypothetical protein IJD68_05105 [Ruminococcus sp.]|nr:hypothetical protein [Ruminococcus sp.]